MKILVSCYACSPYKGSEPGMGWNFVREIARRHELHILVESKFQNDIERYLVQYPEECINKHFYLSPSSVINCFGNYGHLRIIGSIRNGKGKHTAKLWIWTRYITLISSINLIWWATVNLAICGN